jgi:tetratricopeptide (TPR) repeat protein
VAGSVVSTKGGEELQFAREGGWRGVELRQDLIGGDAVRTNAIGTLGILFADQTQIRVGRNSSLVVNEVSSGQNNTQLELQGGQVWARANRGGSGVDVKTPAAVAAIRGTDWSLSVDGNGKTSLVVLEGVVELRNPQGSVTVRQGEGAVAAIGQAPTKFILVRPNDREQMLFYVTLRDVFVALPALPLKGPALRAERARIGAIAPDARRAEDWLSLAEIALRLDGRQAAGEALAAARRLPLSRAQQSRAFLVEGLLAGTRRQWREAAALFARAESGLDAQRRITGAYGRYIAASLADPERVLSEPRTGRNSPEAALAHALVTGFREDLQKAADLLAQAEKRYPGDPRIAVFSAQLAFALNRRDEMRKSVERARALDPGNQDVLSVSGMIKADVDSDRQGALADLRQAAAIAPGRSEIWNTIAMIESEMEASLEAEASFRRAIEADPDDPVPYGNLAIHLLEQSRVAEAGALIDKALELDPDFHVAYIARGRYLLQKGDTAGAIESILAGSTANPAYSQGLLMAAIAYYHNGELELADQAFDNADRLDPNDPAVSIVRTAVAIDQYRADDAIRHAREAVRRSRARGGDYSGLAVNRQSGSYPVSAYRFINLNEWARFYGDRTFDPFAASSYFDQSSISRPSLLTTRPSLATVETGTEDDITTFNLVVQGLLFDPLALAGRVGRADLTRRPFVDAEVGGGVISRGGELGWQSDALVRGYTNEPLPTAFSFNVGRTDARGPFTIDNETLDNASFFIGGQPSAANRFLLFGAASKQKPGPLSFTGENSLVYSDEQPTSTQFGAGWSHTFGYRNVLTAAVFGSRGDTGRYEQRAGFDALPVGDDLVVGYVDIVNQQKTRVDAISGNVNHSIGFDDFTLRYGAEFIRGETRVGARTQTSVIIDGQSFLFDEPQRTEATFRSNRLYADLFWRPTPWFEAQAGVEHTSLSIETLPTDNHASPRVGVGLSPFEGQWLRAAYRTDTVQALPLTLAPITTVGLIPNALPVALGGRTDTLALRWDAEWTPNLFTAVEYQRQDVRNLEIPIAESYDKLAIEKARVDRLAATANLWLGYGIGLFGTVGTTTSEIRAGEGDGLDVPFTAERFARAGITWVHPSRIKLTLAQTYVGERTGNLAGTQLGDYWTTDASITWETPDRRLLIGLTALNLFDEEYELAPGLPGPSRTLAATLRARF